MMREFMKKGKGFWLALAICLCLGVGFIAAAMPALADEAAAGAGQTVEDSTYTNESDTKTDNVLVDKPEEEPMLFALEPRVGEHQDHPICGASCSGHEDTHGEVTWKPWPTDGSAPTEQGYYYLTEDVTLTEAWEPANETALCLNGHTLSRSSYAIELSDDNITFTLTDCTGNGKISAPAPVYLSGNTSHKIVFDMYGGTLAGTSASSCGVDLWSCPGGVFNMYGGTIDNMAIGVRVADQGEFNMYGGTISNSIGGIDNPDDMTKSSSLPTHAGVMISAGATSPATFNMHGGRIINGSGHGVILFRRNSTSNELTFNMYDGEISGNAGAGVVARYYGVNSIDYYNINFYGGTITGNESGGVDIAQDKVTIGIHGQNNINITGNKKNAVECNVYMTARTSESYSPVGEKIRLPGSSDSTAKIQIGITYKYSYAPFSSTAFGTPEFPVRLSGYFSSQTEIPQDWFVSDEPDKYYLYAQPKDSGSYYLAVVHKPHMHGDDEYEEFNGATMPTTAGNYYLSEDMVLGKGGWSVPNDGETVLCLNGHTLTCDSNSSNTPVITVPAGATLTLCDCSEDKTGTVSGLQTNNSFAVQIDGGTLNMDGVVLEGACSTVVSVTDGGEFNMDGGQITYNGNDPDFNSRAVSVGKSSRFNMSDGLITGAGTGVHTSNGSIINLTGGEISGNNRFGVNISSGTTATLAGVHIVDNKFVSSTNTFNGVGVIVPGSDRDATTSITIGTGTVIKDNYIVYTNGNIDDPHASNMYLTNAFETMTIDGTLKDGTEIHVYYDDSKDYGTNHIASNTVSSNENYFFSDVPAKYYIKHSGNFLIYSSGPEPPRIIKQPSAPELGEGESPVGKDLTVEVNNPDKLTYQWQYYPKGEYVPRNVPDDDGGKAATFKVPDWEPGTYYFFCTITNETGGEVDTYSVEITIPEKTENPDVSITIPADGQPSAPTGDNPVGEEIKVEATGGTGTLTYQWYYNTVDSTTGGTKTGGNSPTCKIPNLAPGTYYFYCEITDEDGHTTKTNTVKIVIPNGDNPGSSITIPDSGQPTAPGVPEGESPVGEDLTVTVDNPENKTLTYQWKYSENANGEPGTNVPAANGGNGPTCKIPDLEPGTYYFYCEITDEDDHTTKTNIVTIVIPEKKGEVLNPGGSITTDDGTEVKRSDTEENGGDGGKTVTIDKDTTDGTDVDVTITLPDNNKDGEVTVDKETGEVTVPGGSTVSGKDTDNPDDKTPDVTIGEQGGTVTPEGEVKIPEGGTANVGGETDGNGNTTGGTTITGGDGGTTIKPEDDGSVHVSEGGSVKTDPENPSGGNNEGAEITLPNGGNVNPDNGTITPDTDDDGKQIAGVDTNGDGKVDTLIVLPGTEGGDPNGGTLTPNENGGVDLPGGTEIIAGGSEEDKGNGEGGASVILPESGEVTPGGGVKPEGDKVLTGEDKNNDGKPDTTVTLPEGGEIKGDGEGGLEVPGGTTVKNGDDGKEITIGDKDDPTGGNGGTLNPEGGIDLPEGGKATVDNGKDENDEKKPDTIITGGEGGSTITPNPDGTTDVSGGTSVKTGEDGTEITVGDNEGQGGTVNKDGDLELPAGGSATIGGGKDENGNEKPKTEITVPKDATPGENTTIKDNGDGNVEVPEGSKVQTETSTGGEDKESTEIILPEGGSVKEGGEITPGTDDDGKQIAGVDTDGDGKPDTLIVLPGTDGGEILKPNDNGGVDVPGGTELKSVEENGDDTGSKVVVGEQGGSVNNEGGVDLPKDGSATIENENGENSEVTAGENGGTVKPNPDGTTDVSGDGTKVQVGGEDSGKPPVTVDDKGASVTPDGDIEIKDGASVTVGGDDGKPGTTITAPGGKDDGNGGTTTGNTTVTPKEDGTVDVGQGGTVTTGGENGEPGTPITLPEGGNVKPEDGTVTPEGGKIATGEDTDGDGIPDTIIILPEDKPTITPGTDGGITLPGGSTIQGGENGPDIVLPDGGTINPDGSGVQPNGDLTIPGENGQPNINVTLPEGGTISSDENGGLKVPAGTEVKQEGEDAPTVVIGDNGGTIADGGVTLPEDGSVTIDDMEVKTPQGGKVDVADGSTTAPVIEINGIVITAPEGEEVTTDRNGNTPVGPSTVISKPGDGAESGTQVQINSGSPTVDKDGILTFPNGGEIVVTKNDGTTETITVPAGGTIDINTVGGGSSSRPGSSSGGSSGGSSSSAPIISRPEHGTVTINPTRPQPGDKVTITPKPASGYQVDTVTVKDKNGNPVQVTKNPDGTYTFTQPELQVTIDVKFAPITTAAVSDFRSCSKGADCLLAKFTDLQTSAWYHDGVHYCLANSIMNGVSATMFAPNDNTTRAQIVTIIYRAEGEPAAGSSSFADVGDNQYYTKAVAWAAANGIVKGYSETQFAPDDNVTREQLAAILYRYGQFKGRDVSAKGNLAAYSDNGRISEYALSAMEWAVGSGLMNGNTDGTLNPVGQATRAEVATMIMRFCENIAAN